MRASDFPAITVVKKDGKYYSLDNRRLYIFRVLHHKGKLPTIAVYLTNDSINPSKFTTKNDGRKICVRQGSTLHHEIPTPPPSPVRESTKEDDHEIQEILLEVMEKVEKFLEETAGKSGQNSPEFSSNLPQQASIETDNGESDENNALTDYRQVDNDIEIKTSKLLGKRKRSKRNNSVEGKFHKRFCHATSLRLHEFKIQWYRKKVKESKLKLLRKRICSSVDQN
ncbi:uncharacterized protein LOC143466152 [Clavelina lepadiformis]|uniref:uncharacterized protein LOC143466152 n=1 Tax=Clavelina lepadiformis TaxID=159417 RepID=UPI0040429715